MRLSYFPTSPTDGPSLIKPQCFMVNENNENMHAYVTTNFLVVNEPTTP